MNVTKLGVITALKNVGLFLTTFKVANVTADPTEFVYAAIIFACISVPSDLYLLNRAHENGAKQ